MKAALVMAMTVCLAGCNMVVTDKPMFSAGDGVGSPPLHPGVWRREQVNCDFDERQPEDLWPLCSNAQPSLAASPLWQEVSGDPILLQTPISLPGAKASETMYIYIAVRPLWLDAAGRVVAMRSWPVRCGPPPPPKAPKHLAVPELQHKPDSMTRAEWAELQGNLAKLQAASDKLQAQLDRAAPTQVPLPGLKMDKDSGGCAPDSVASLRNAARMSEAWAGDGTMSHWVRDRGPGDKPPATPAALIGIAGGGLAPASLGSTP